MKKILFVPLLIIILCIIAFLGYGKLNEVEKKINDDEMFEVIDRIPGEIGEQEKNINFKEPGYYILYGESNVKYICIGLAKDEMGLRVKNKENFDNQLIINLEKSSEPNINKNQIRIRIVREDDNIKVLDDKGIEMKRLG